MTAEGQNSEERSPVAAASEELDEERLAWLALALAPGWGRGEF